MSGHFLTNWSTGTVSTASPVSFSFLATASVLSAADTSVRGLKNTRRDETAKSVLVIEVAILFGALQLERCYAGHEVSLVKITTDARGPGRGASPEVEIGSEETILERSMSAEAWRKVTLIRWATLKSTLNSEALYLKEKWASSCNSHEYHINLSIQVVVEQSQQPWVMYDAGPRAVKSPLVCLPPVCGTADVFFQQLMYLSDRGFRVISVSKWNNKYFMHTS